MAIAVLALGVIDWASPEDHGRLSRRPHLNIRIVAAMVLLLLAFLGGQMGVGLLVTLVALVLPEAMAYAGIAGMPPETGLYAAPWALIA